MTVAVVRCRKCHEEAREEVPAHVTTLSFRDREVRCTHCGVVLIMWATSTEVSHGWR